MFTLKQPSFWRRDEYLSSTSARLKVAALQPFSLLYHFGYKIHHSLVRPKKFKDLFIICVGNITAGGAGKTPSVIMLAEIFKDFDPVILSKGYGGSSARPRYVQLTDRAEEIGDEPLLMARRGLKVITARSRLDGLRFAQEQKHSLIIMDDGMQNPNIKADYNICVIDSGFGFGNKKLLPAGPLRAPLSSSIKDINCFISIGEKVFEDKSLKEKTIYKGLFIIDTSYMNQNIYAFAGLGRPEKFYESLRLNGMSISGTKDFPDHYYYTAMDLQELEENAQCLKAKLATTEKDAVKIDLAAHDITVIKGDLKLQNLTELVQDITFSLNKKLHS